MNLKIREVDKIKSRIIVNNANQKKIIIGTSGQNIKKIGIESRLLIEKTYSKDVYINLIVNVNENWKNDIQILKKLDLPHEKYFSAIIYHPC